MSVDSEAQHISVRDFLMPEKALARTGAFDNPLLSYSLRRARRWPRRVMQHSLEAVLLVLGAWTLSSHYSNLLLTYPLAFLLLRYHLLVNDQSHHLKTLRADSLQQLFLTRLKREDYFLHHYLYFCRNYRVIWGFAGLMIVSFSYGLISGKPDLTSYLFLNLLFGICLVLLTWLVGVSQYAVEWRIFAGGQSPISQNIGTGLISLPLAFLATLAATLLTQAAFIIGGESIPLGLLFLFPGLPLILLGAAALVHWQGMGVYQDTAELLWRRFAREDPDWQVAGSGRKTRFLDWLLPWRCLTRPKEDAATLTRFRQNTGRDRESAFISGLILSAGFFFSWACFSLAISSDFYWNFLSYYFPLRAALSFIITKLPIVFLAGYATCRVIRARERAIPFSPRLLLFYYGRWFMLFCLVLPLVSFGLMLVQNDFLSAWRQGMISFGGIIEIALSMPVVYFLYVSCSYLLLAALLLAGRLLFSKRRSSLARYFCLTVAGAAAWIAYLLAWPAFMAITEEIGMYALSFYSPIFFRAILILEVLLMAIATLIIVNTIINHTLAPLSATPPPLPVDSHEADYAR